MADETQFEAWQNEALALGGDERAARALVRRIYEAGQVDQHGLNTEAIDTLQRELAKLRRSAVSSGS
jgi:hypothetical protein